MELTADQKGNIAEAAIAYTALRLGIDVYRPVGEGGRHDLVFGVDDRLIRVDVLCVRCYSSRRNRDGLLRRLYERGEIDALLFPSPRTVRRTGRDLASPSPAEEQPEIAYQLGIDV